MSRTLSLWQWMTRSYPPQPVTWETVFGSREVLAGVSVDQYSALHYSPVWAGVSTLSRDIAKLPLVFYKNLPNGGKKRFTEHKLYRILHDEPNPEMTSFKFRETMQALCILYGNAYAEIVRDQLGRPAGMYPILPSRVLPKRTERGGQLYYEVTNASGGRTNLAPANIIHLSSLSTDGIIGHSIVEHAAESFGLGIATEKFGSAFFGNGATFGGVAEIPGPLDESVKSDMRAAINAVHQGVERAHKILMLANGVKFVKTGTAPNEAQFIETRKFQINETARWLGMPPHKLGDLENAHFTNIEEQELQYYVGCVSGWLKMWEQELSRKLISPLEYSQQTIEHVLEGVLRGDSTKRADYYARMHSIGVFSINDILRLENMNPIGPEGDVHLVPLNMVPAERYQEYFDKKMIAEPAPVKQLPEKTEEQAANEDQAKRALAAAEAARDAALLTAKEFEARHAQAQADIAARISERDAAKAAADAFEAVAAEHNTRADVADEKRTLALLEVEAAQRVVAERETALEAAHEAATKIETERQASESRALAAEQALNDARIELATRSAELGAASLDAERAKQELADRITAAEDAAKTLDVIRTEREASIARATAAEQTAEERAAQLAERRSAELDRLTNVITAHRVLIVHAVQRLLRPEVDRARRRQGTPDQLRKWIDAFYVTHREVAADEFYPPVVTHLAWKRSTDDPRVVARQMAEEHCARSERELRAVIDSADSDPDFHATLEQMLTRWETERPQTAADVLLQDEVNYVRSL